MSTINYIIARSNGTIKKNPITDAKLSDLMARDKRYQVIEDSMQNVAGVEFQMVCVSKSVGIAEWEAMKTLKAGGQSVRIAVPASETKTAKVKAERKPKAEKALLPKAETPQPTGNVDKDIARAEAYISYLKALKAIG